VKSDVPRRVAVDLLLRAGAVLSPQGEGKPGWMRAADHAAGRDDE
jgi:hypothetical protein